MYLFFDTETTGLPPGGDRVHMCQLAWILQSDGGKNHGHGNFIIKPDGWTIPNEVAQIHGITTERALAEGTPVGEVLSIFVACCYLPVWLVAHNMQFDRSILQAEFARLGWEDALHGKGAFCTMQSSVDLCGLKRRDGKPKWPKLEELHRHLFGCGFEGAHDALNDIKATAKCFWELRRLGRI